MKKVILILLFVLLSLFVVFYFWRQNKIVPKKEIAVKKEVNINKMAEGKIKLPQPKLTGEKSLEEAILKRRSKRDFLDKALSLEQISQILWSAQGVTDKEQDFRSAPSAGALYPLEIYLVVGEKGVSSLETGVYHFLPKGHLMEKTLEGDLRKSLQEVCLGQEWVGEAPVSLVIVAEYERTTKKYGERGIRYVWLEAGHATQNVLLQLTSLDLGGVTVGAFDDKQLIKVLNLPEKYQPLYVIPLGFPK